jgi:hypothetical protein
MKAVTTIETAMFWLAESFQYLKVLIPIFLQFMSRSVVLRSVRVHCIIVLSFLILIGFSILQAEMKRDFPLSTSQNAASDAWRRLRWTMRQRWNIAIQSAELPSVSLLKFHVKWPCCPVLSSTYCGRNFVKWVLHSCIFHTLCTLKYTYVLHTQHTLKSLI